MAFSITAWISSGGREEGREGGLLVFCFYLFLFVRH
jgi:hypothetical protein